MVRTIAESFLYLLKLFWGDDALLLQTLQLLEFFVCVMVRVVVSAEQFCLHLLVFRGIDESLVTELDQILYLVTEGIVFGAKQSAFSEDDGVELVLYDKHDD